MKLANTTLNRRGRITLIALLCGLIGLTGAANNARASAPTPPIITQNYIIQPGDTWWEISNDYRKPGQDKREAIAELMHLNNRNTANLQIGETIQLPILTRH